MSKQLVSQPDSIAVEFAKAPSKQKGLAETERNRCGSYTDPSGANLVKT